MSKRLYCIPQLRDAIRECAKDAGLTVFQWGKLNDIVEIGERPSDPDSKFTCCDRAMSFDVCWDEPNGPFAFNIYFCAYCGRLIKEMVWDNSGTSECKAGEHFRNKKEIFEARCLEVDPCPDCGPSIRVLDGDAGKLYCGKCNRVLLKE